MNVIQPLELMATTKVVTLQGKHQLCISVQLAMPLMKADEQPLLPLLQPDFINETSEALANDILDEGNPKLSAEYYVLGKVASPNKQPVQGLEVSVTLAEKTKTLRVMGDRYWLGGLTGYTDPIPFTEMPLSWSRSFGGKKFPENPLGIGMDTVSNELGKNLYPLANFEAMNEFADRSRKEMTPVNFAPVPLEFKQRQRFMGTYNSTWEKHRAPYLPDDFNLKAFHRASVDQQAADQSRSAFYQGGEAFRLEHFHADYPVIHGKIPKYRVRVFYTIGEPTPDDIQVSDLKELTLNLDTVTFVPNQLMVNLTYRALVPSPTADGSHIHTLLACYENQADPVREKSHYHVSLVGRIHERFRDIFEHTTQDLIPNDHICGHARADEVAPETPMGLQGQQMAIKMAALSAAIEAEANAQEAAMDELLTKHDIPKPTPEPEDKKRAQLQADVDDAWSRLNEGKPPKEHSLDPRLLDDGAWEAYEKAQKALSDHDNKTITHLLEQQKSQLESQLANQLENGSEHAQKPLNKTIAELDEAILQMTAAPEIELPRPRVDEEILSSIESATSQVDSAIAKADVNAAASLPSVEPLSQEEKEDIRTALENAAESERENYRLTAHELPWCPVPDQRPNEVRMNAFWERQNNGLSHRGMDYAGLDFSRLDLRYIDFSDCYLEQCKFNDANLRHATFDNAIVSKSSFENANLSHASLKSTNLGNCNFSLATLDLSDWENCIIEESYFDGASLQKLDFYPDMSLKGVVAKNANFSDSVFRQIAMEENVFTGSRFDNTIWQNATIDQCLMSDCQFNNMQCQHLEIASSDLSHAQFEQCNLTEFRIFNASNLNQTKFERTVSNDSTFHDSDLSETTFQDCQLNLTVFVESRLQYARFHQSELQDSDFSHTNCQHATFKDCNMLRSSFYLADITSAKLINSNLYEVEFTESTVGKTKFNGSNLQSTILEHWRPDSWS